MISRCLYTAALAATMCGIAVADEFLAHIRKIEDGKVTFVKYDKDDRTSPRMRKEVMLPAAKDLKVSIAEMNWKNEKIELGRGEELRDGLDNEQLKSELEQEQQRRKGIGGILAWIVTDDGGAMIHEIRVWFPPKPGAPRPPVQMKSALSPKGEAAYDRVMKGMQENRNRLETGVFRAKGLYSDLDPDHGDLRDSVDIYCAFDRPRDKIRFDRSAPYKIGIPPEELKDADKPARLWRVAFLQTKFILTPNEVVSTERGNNVVYIDAPPQKQAQNLRSRGLPFDVRSLGLNYWRGFERYARFEDVYQARTKWKPREISRDPQGLWKIVWEQISPVHFEDTIWVDEAKGFTITRSEWRDALSGSNPINWKEPTNTNEVAWMLQNEAWVPKTFKLQNRRGKQLLSYDLSFEWDSVNKAVPDTVFTIEGLGIADRRQVIDRSSGQPVIRGILNDKPE